MLGEIEVAPSLTAAAVFASMYSAPMQHSASGPLGNGFARANRLCKSKGGDFKRQERSRMITSEGYKRGHPEIIINSGIRTQK